MALTKGQKRLNKFIEDGGYEILIRNGMAYFARKIIHRNSLFRNFTQEDMMDVVSSVVADRYAYVMDLWGRKAEKFDQLEYGGNPGGYLNQAVSFALLQYAKDYTKEASRRVPIVVGDQDYGLDVERSYLINDTDFTPTEIEDTADASELLPAFRKIVHDWTLAKYGPEAAAIIRMTLLDQMSYTKAAQAIGRTSKYVSKTHKKIQRKFFEDHPADVRQFGKVLGEILKQVQPDMGNADSEVISVRIKSGSIRIEYMAGMNVYMAFVAVKDAGEGIQYYLDTISRFPGIGWRLSEIKYGAGCKLTWARGRSEKIHLSAAECLTQNPAYKNLRHCLDLFRSNLLRTQCN